VTTDYGGLELEAYGLLEKLYLSGEMVHKRQVGKSLEFSSYCNFVLIQKHCDIKPEIKRCQKETTIQTKINTPKPSHAPSKYKIAKSNGNFIKPQCECRTHVLE